MIIYKMLRICKKASDAVLNNVFSLKIIIKKYFILISSLSRAGSSIRDKPILHVPE